MYIVDNKTYNNKNGSYIGTKVKQSVINGKVISRYAPTGSGVYNINDVHNAIRASKWPVESNGLLIHYDMADLASYGQITFQSFDLGSSSSNGNHVNLAYSSVLGGSVLYDGTSDYVSIPATTCAFGTGQFTLEFWVNATGYFGSRGCLFQTAGTNVNGSMQVWYDDTNGTYMTIRDAAGITTTYFFGFFIVGNTVQITITRAANGTLTCIIKSGNNTNSSVGGTSTQDISNASSTLIGIQSTGAGQVFKGYLGIFRAYNVALTPAQITANFNINRARFGI